ncbi:uncharacterized protein LOC110399250 isoform X2 [Numida meleagris]|uniref:uncharacterized protein LOC110399250 isoform X2 n=1 Tax=Numida meleagris TaxID=8996 RepID=UPI000B3DEF82|nr:uncharacterized protein LOC110399250 isoform X2 [Numida meleagris]
MTSSVFTSGQSGPPPTARKDIRVLCLQAGEGGREAEAYSKVQGRLTRSVQQLLPSNAPGTGSALGLQPPPLCCASTETFRCAPWISVCSPGANTQNSETRGLAPGLESQHQHAVYGRLLEPQSHLPPHHTQCTWVQQSSLKHVIPARACFRSYSCSSRTQSRAKRISQDFISGIGTDVLLENSCAMLQFSDIQRRISKVATYRFLNSKPVS